MATEPTDRQERRKRRTRQAIQAAALELFAERGLLNQYQALVSRQGEPIDDLQPLRDRLDHLQQVAETLCRVLHMLSEVEEDLFYPAARAALAPHRSHEDADRSAS